MLHWTTSTSSKLSASKCGSRSSPLISFRHRTPRQCKQIVCSQAGPGVNMGSSSVRGAASAPTPASVDAQSALVRRPTAPQIVFVDISQVIGKQVITRTTGRNLGTISCMWVDPVRYEVVSLDLERKEGVQSTRVANFPLYRLTQIGDVVLVHDDSVLFDAPMDGRFGYYNLVGMDVRTRSGEFLGKVRDVSFSPDNGAINRVVYDDFGLSFLPVSFFDTFSLSMADVLSLGPGGVIVPDEAKYRERRETQGLFAAIPSLLRSVSGSGMRGGSSVAGALTDGFRKDGGVAGYLPSGYSYEQWEMDVRRWEQETGMSYDQYVRATGQQGGQQGHRQPAALPSPRMQHHQQQQQAYGGGFAQPAQAPAPKQQTGYAGFPQRMAAMQAQQAYGQQAQQAYGQQAQQPYQPQQQGPDPRTTINPTAPQHLTSPRNHPQDTRSAAPAHPQHLQPQQPQQHSTAPAYGSAASYASRSQAQPGMPQQPQQPINQPQQLPGSYSSGSLGPWSQPQQAPQAQPQQPQQPHAQPGQAQAQAPAPQGGTRVKDAWGQQRGAAAAPGAPVEGRAGQGAGPGKASPGSSSSGWGSSIGSSSGTGGGAEAGKRQGPKP